MKNIVLVEDDPRLATLVQQFLQQNHFQVSIVDRGNIAVATILTQDPDLVILDIMLPDMDGFSICKKIRPHYLKPIIFLTAKDSDFDHVLGLEIGADDYLIKPIEPHVLLARINNALRRANHELQTTDKVLSFGKLTINKQARFVQYDNQVIDLTTHEYELLCLLAAKPGEVQSRDYIHQKMIGREYDGLDRSVDVRISRLRKKLLDNIDSPTRIITVWGKGYVFNPAAWE